MSTNPKVSAGFAGRAEPETFRARTISASLAVKDVQKSLAWYRDKVGFFVEQKFERGGKLTGVSLKAGDAIFAHSLRAESTSDGHYSRLFSKHHDVPTGATYRQRVGMHHPGKLHGRTRSDHVVVPRIYGEHASSHLRGGSLDAVRRR